MLYVIYIIFLDLQFYEERKNIRDKRREKEQRKGERWKQQKEDKTEGMWNEIKEEMKESLAPYAGRDGVVHGAMCYQCFMWHHGDSLIYLLYACKTEIHLRFHL
jgi:hypothetical protein